MLLRNKNYCPDTNAWCIFFCQPKANSARSSNIPVKFNGFKEGSDNILLVGKYLFLGNFSGQNTLSKIMALIV